MRRANHLSAVAIVSIVTLAAALAGCRDADPESDSHGRAASGNSAVASNDLPEVVISAPRPRSKTINLSAHGVGAASR